VVSKTVVGALLGPLGLAACLSGAVSGSPQAAIAPQQRPSFSPSSSRTLQPQTPVHLDDKTENIEEHSSGSLSGPSGAFQELAGVPPSPKPIPKQRGVALGLFAEDVSHSYAALLREIADLGASHVALIVPLYQEHGRSTKLYWHTRFSPTLETVADTIRDARSAGLEVTVFPIVRLEKPRQAGEWRGTLTPADRTAWFDSYTDKLGDLAAIAAWTGATRLVIGSELSTLDTEIDAWRPLVRRVRGLFPGKLLYSSNWDHYRKVKIFALTDELGLTAYFRLRKSDSPANLRTLTDRWFQIRETVESWAQRFSKPLVFTEVGYRSRSNATVSPWDESAGGQVDLDEQRLGFEAFRKAWSGAKQLSGIYIWNWYGHGGRFSTGYTPRGKPAADEIKRLLQAL